MTDPLKKLAHDMKSVRLTEPEKTALRGDLLHFMKENPATQQAPRRVEDPSEDQGSWLGSFLMFLVPRPMPVLAAMMVIAVSGGGISFAAEGSLPGDLLYPVKVSINEEVTALFKVSQADKLQWEIKRSERRLAEADILKQRGTLNDSAMARLSEGIESHDASIERLENKLQMNGQDEVLLALQTEYEAKLNLYQDVLFEVLTSTSAPVAVVTPPPAGFEEAIPTFDSGSKETVHIPVVRPTPTVAPVVTPVVAPVVTPTYTTVEALVADQTETTFTDFVRDFRQPQPVQPIQPIQPIQPVQPAQPEFFNEAEANMDRASNKIMEADQAISKVASATGYDPLSDAQNRLKNARTAYNEGESLFYGDQAYRKAYNAFDTAYELAEQARALADRALQSFNATPIPKPEPIPVPIDPQLAWADKAKSQMTTAADTYEEISNYVNDLIQRWGRDPFLSVSNRLSSAKDALNKGYDAYNRAAYLDAYNSFAESYSLIDQATSDAINIEDNLESDQRADEAASLQARTMMETTLNRFMEVSLYVEKIAGTTNSEAIAVPLEMLEKARSIYDDGNVLFERGDYVGAYNQFKQSFLLLDDAEAEATRVFTESQVMLTPLSPDLECSTKNGDPTECVR